MIMQLATSCGLLTVPEAAQALRVSPDTVRALVREGRLKAVRVRPRGRLLFDPADVRAALQQAHAKPAHAG